MANELWPRNQIPSQTLDAVGIRCLPPPQREDGRHELPPGDEEIAEAILRYLAEHPQAMDTVEGIAQWWIMRQQMRVTTTRVTRVLCALTERGLLEELGDGEHRRYRLKPH